MAQPLRDPASDERELTQLVKDLNAAVVKADIAFLEDVLHEDYTHHRPRGTVEHRAQYLENRKTGRLDFERTNTGQWMSPVAGPACSFGGTGAGSSSTPRGQ